MSGVVFALRKLHVSRPLGLRRGQWPGSNCRAPANVWRDVAHRCSRLLETLAPPVPRAQ
jgi:hypothetical protein